MRVFYDRHLCRVPWPDCVQRSFDQIDADPTVYHTMNGPSEFHVIGSLKHWDITDRLHEIDVADAARLRPLRRGHAADRRPDPRAHPRREWALFEESSHMPHVEEPEAFLHRVEEFLGRSTPTRSWRRTLAR